MAYFAALVAVFVVGAVAVVGSPVALVVALVRRNAPWGALFFAAVAVGCFFYYRGLISGSFFTLDSVEEY